jgi:septal ring factor EnvC (AmiA/AmiB activator)
METKSRTTRALRDLKSKVDSLSAANQQLTATLSTADTQIRTLTDARVRAEGEVERLRRTSADDGDRIKRVVAAERARYEVILERTG